MGMKGRRFKRFCMDICFPREVSCVLCGKDLRSLEKCLCGRCQTLLERDKYVRRDIDGITALYAPFQYKEPIKSLIYRFKYQNQRYLARFFAYELFDLLPKDAFEICAVPLHKARKRERGFSQTDELCREIEFVACIPWNKDALTRVRNTPSQTQLAANERLTNVKSAFKVNKMSKHAGVVLIDDVATTGSTLYECAAELHKAGVAQVNAVVIAM